LQIPALYHGPYDEVDARCRTLVARVGAGVPWLDAIGAPVDTREAAGLLVLNGPSPLIGGSAHFQCYLPHFRVRDALGDGRLSGAVEAAVFAASLESPWGVLGLLAPPNVMWLHARERHRSFVRASLRCWDALTAEGARYSLGMPAGGSLDAAQHNLRYVLANLGVPAAALRGSLSPSRLAELVDGLHVNES
jgi:hypothetical protein